MKRKIKKIICALVMTLCMLGSGVSVLAETVSFDITVPGDIISKKATKADSEQAFYVTGTSFNKTGNLKCVSIRYDDSSVKSNTAKISSTNISSSASYKSYAKSGVYYYMSTTASVSDLHVTGRYTP